MATPDCIIHVKFSCSSYLKCKIENIYVYEPEHAKNKVNPLVGATLITKDTELINMYCEKIYPKDIVRRKRLYEQYKAKTESAFLDPHEQNEETVAFLSKIRDIYCVRPTLCDEVIENRLQRFLQSLEFQAFICTSSGGNDFILSCGTCSLNVLLKSGESQRIDCNLVNLLVD